MFSCTIFLVVFGNMGDPATDLEECGSGLSRKRRQGPEFVQAAIHLGEIGCGRWMRWRSSFEAESETEVEEIFGEADG